MIIGCVILLECFSHLIKENAAVNASSLHQVFLATRVESDVVGDVIDLSCIQECRVCMVNMLAHMNQLVLSG